MANPGGQAAYRGSRREGRPKPLNPGLVNAKNTGADGNWQRQSRRGAGGRARGHSAQDEAYAQQQQQPQPQQQRQQQQQQHPPAPHAVDAMWGADDGTYSGFAGDMRWEQCQWEQGQPWGYFPEAAGLLNTAPPDLHAAAHQLPPHLQQQLHPAQPQPQPPLLTQQGNPINFMKDHEITKLEPPWQSVTTVMMRNLPNKYCLQMLLDEILEKNFRLERDFDFFYLPMDHANAVNLGYCFINFVETSVANDFAAAFAGKRMKKFNSSKTVVVMPASIQGYDRNYAYYSSTRVAQAEDPQYRPVFTRPPPTAAAGEVAAPPPAAVAYPPQPCGGIPAAGGAAPSPATAVATQMWAAPIDVSMAYGGWDVPMWTEVATPHAYQHLTSHGFVVGSDDEVDYAGISHMRTQSDRSASWISGVDMKGDYFDVKSQTSSQEPEIFSGPPSRPLVVRNTFLQGAVHRSPSVERCLERHCKSCPVSKPHSEASGSGRLQLADHPEAALDYAMLAAANSLARDLGYVSRAPDAAIGTVSKGSRDGSYQETPLRSSANSTMAESDRDASSSGAQVAAPRAPGSSSGSVELRSETSPSEQEAPVLGSPEFPNKGSALHKFGGCKPCAFQNLGGQAACKNGVECTFCHLCETGEKKRRKKEARAVKREQKEVRRKVEQVRREKPLMPVGIVRRKN